MAARRDVEAFAGAVRDTLGGSAFQVACWPYRYAGSMWWTFDADGPDGRVCLRFVETGRTRLQPRSLWDEPGELADTVDAHCLFELLERELAQSV